MRRFQHIIYPILTACVLFISLPSCINDDLSECDVDKRIYFNYTPKSTTYSAVSLKEGINPSEVTKMNLFIFDEKGKFVKEVIDTSPTLSNDYYMTVNGLKTGNYTFIAWGSLDNNYYSLSNEFVEGQTTINDVELYLNRIQSSTTGNAYVRDSLPSLFHASHSTNTVAVNSNVEQRFDMDLIQDTYKFNISATGFDSTYIADHNFQMAVTDNNNRYNFDNSFASGSEFDYIRNFYKQNDNKKLSNSITVMRIAENRSPILTLSNPDTNETLVQDNLVELVLLLQNAGYTVDLSNQYEFDIEYKFDNFPAQLTIIINGWVVVREEGSVGK